MTSRSFVRVYRRVVGQVLSPFEFKRIGSDFWRTRDGLLHAIVLHKSDPWTFTGEFAVQALSYPFPTFILDFGDRVNVLVPGHQGWWSVPEDRLDQEEVVSDYAQALAEHVVPWLDRFQSCRDVVEIQRHRRWGIRGYDRAKTESSKHAIMLGICALVAQMPDAAREYLKFAQQEYRKFLRPDSPPWYREDLQLVDNYLALLTQGDWEGIRAKLAEGEAFTRKSIGLPPFDSSDKVNPPKH